MSELARGLLIIAAAASLVIGCGAEQHQSRRSNAAAILNGQDAVRTEEALPKGKQSGADTIADSKVDDSGGDDVGTDDGDTSTVTLMLPPGLALTSQLELSVPAVCQAFATINQLPVSCRVFLTRAGG